MTNTFVVAWDDRPDIASVRVYVGTNTRSYQRFVETTNDRTPVTVTRRSDEKVYLAATVINALGVESDYSREITYPYAYQWLVLSWDRPASVIVQASPALGQALVDWTNATGTNLQFDIPAENRFYGLRQPAGGPPLTLAIRKK